MNKRIRVVVISIITLGVVLMNAVGPVAVQADTGTPSATIPAAAGMAQALVGAPSKLKVVGRFLQDGNGNNLMMRGVNVPVYKSGWADDLNAVASAVASTKVNVVRLEWWANPPAGTTQYTVANLDRAIQKYTDLGILPIVELHDLTFQYGHDAKTGANSDGNDQALFARTITAYWTRPDVAAVLIKHQDHVVINLANEWGSSTYSDGSSTAANFIQNYTTAITAIRKAGITAPLMVDAPKGFEYQFMLDNGQAILNADPQKNTLLSVHAYWAASAYSDTAVNAILNAIQNSGLPIVLGEVSSDAWTTIQCDPVHYANLLTTASLDQIGFLIWAWYEDGTCGANMNITVNADGVTVPTFSNPGFGYDVIYNKVYGIKVLNGKTNSAVKPLTYTPPSLCPTIGDAPTDLFYDNMESGPTDTNWVYSAAVGLNDWSITSSGGIIDGTYSLYGPDVITINDSNAAMNADVTLPNQTSYLYFKHQFDFEWDLYSSAYDGGVLEYSTDHGSTWQDAGPLFSAGQNYNLTIFPVSDYGNPLGGRQAFSGNSGGTVASRYDLTSLAGKTVRFRWRIGTDSSVGSASGWYVDDVEIYTCPFAVWSGGVSITSDRNVVAVGRPQIGSQVMTYDGFSSGSLTQYAPMLFKNMWGYDSALYVQDVDPSNTATISIKFYDTNGNLTCSVPDSISPLASKGYWLPSISCLGTSWVGGVTVTSDHNIVAVGRPHLGSEITTYNGFASGNSTMYVPMLFKNMWGYDSALYIQDIDPSNTAAISIKFYDTSGNLTCTMPDSIPPLSSHGYWLPSISCLGTSWVGGVVITSDHNIVAVGRPHLGTAITTYDGFPSGSSIANMPMMFANAYGGSYNSALYVQDVDPGNTAHITIQFHDNNGNLTCTQTDSISPLSSHGYWLPSLSCLGSSWIGSITVTSDYNIVAVGRPHLGSEVATYDGFTASALTSSLPMLFRNAFGGSYNSALYVQNIDPSNTANITVNFYDTNGNLSCTRNDSIPALGVLGYWLPSVTCMP